MFSGGADNLIRVLNLNFILGKKIFRFGTLKAMIN